MPHLSPMQWTTMFISTWLLVMTASAKMHPHKKKHMSIKKYSIMKKNHWNIYSSTMLNCKFIAGMLTSWHL